MVMAPVSNVQTFKSIWSSLQIQVCSLVLTASLFNVARLPRDTYLFGPLPYLLAFSASSVFVALPIALLQLALGQLTHQDPVGVWRAVPVLRGAGHLKILSSYLLCIYNTIYIAIAAGYLIWIVKGEFPLKECIKLKMTSGGYEERMNASECFNSTFLAPFTQYQQYVGVMAIIIFFLWCFIPIFCLYSLRKSMKATFVVCVLPTFILASILAAAVGESRWIVLMFSKPVQWQGLMQPQLWHAALVQALLSTQIHSGYLISSGGNIYKNSNIKWTATTIILENLIAGWFWVLFWESTSENSSKDTSFVAILVLIYQAAVNERRAKQWPIIALAIILVSGIITVVTLLYPIFDRLQRVAGDRWRVFACAGSILGTALTLAILILGQEVLLLLDSVAMPCLIMFTTVLEVVAFIFIYGWDNLMIDIEFLLNRKLCPCWVLSWWISPFILLGVSGWWMRFILREAWLHHNIWVWRMFGILIAALAIIVIFAAIAVAKEEQFNLLSKIAAAFRPSTLWGPEDPITRYTWISKKGKSALQIRVGGSDESDKCSIPKYKANEKSTEKVWGIERFVFPRPYFSNPAFECDNSYQRHSNEELNDIDISSTKAEPTLTENYKYFPSIIPNNSISTIDNDHQENCECKCKRHFILRVPHYVNGELTTTL